MPIMVNCSCGNVMSVEDAFAGKTVICNQCQRVVPVPAVGPAASVAATPGTAESAANPYMAQNAGYATAPQPGGYSAPPSAYYSPQATGAPPPSRGLLITGGVLAILAYLGFASWMGLFSVAAANGKLETIPSAAYGLLALLALAGIVFASLSFASMPWAAITSAILLLILSGLTAFSGTEVSDPDAATATYVAAGWGVLALIFSGLGIGQAKRYRAWKGVG